MWILTICCEPSSSYSSSSSSSIWVWTAVDPTELISISPIGPIGPIHDTLYRHPPEVTLTNAARPDRGRGRTAYELTLLLNPRTSNIRKNKSPNYGRQPIPAGGHSHQPERTISTRNCPELTSATRRIDDLIDLFLPHKPHTGSAVAGPPDECKSRRHLSSEWQVLRR
jgi:hypothetical protein